MAILSPVHRIGGTGGHVEIVDKTQPAGLPLYAMRAIAPLGLATALSLTGDATLYSVLPTHPADAGIALGSVGLILSINRIIRLGTNGPAGWLFDRVPDRRPLFLGSLLLGVLSTAIYTLSSGLELLLVGRLLWGLAWSGIWVGGNAIILEMAPEQQRGRWVGIYQMWFFFGSALGSFLGGVLTDAVGYRDALWIGAGISAFGAAASMAALVDERARARVNRRRVYPPGNLGLSRPRWSGISPSLAAIAAAQGMNRLVVAGIIAATLGLVVQQGLGQPNESANWQLGGWQIGVASVTGGLLASRTLVSLVGAPFTGIWSDAGGRRGRWLAVSLLVGGVGMALLAVANLWIAILGTFITALASGSIQSLTTTLAGGLGEGNRHGANLGVLYTAADLGSAIGPLAAYALLPLTGLPAIFLGCAVAMLLVAVICGKIVK